MLNLVGIVCHTADVLKEFRGEGHGSPLARLCAFIGSETAQDLDRQRRGRRTFQVREGQEKVLEERIGLERSMTAAFSSPVASMVHSVSSQ
jgi:hypothetical protein